MNKFFLASFFIVNVCLSNAVFLKKPVDSRFATFNQLRNIADNDFGKRILDTIALQLQNQSPLGDVAKMLNDILANLRAQQTEADSLRTSQQLECKDDIAKFTSNRDTCQINANDAEEQIGILTSEIKALGVKIVEMGRQLDILANRSVQLAQARENDAQAFAKRQAQGPGVVAALDLIVEKLKTITPTSVDGAFIELAKLGKSNPIAALLQVASTFSAETLENVQNKMIELKESIEASLVEDEKNEVEAAAQYKQIVGEIASTRKNVAAAKAEAESSSKQKQSSLALNQKKLADNTKCVIDNNAKLAAKIELCAAWEAKYAADTKGRNEEISVIEQVKEIVATKLSTMKDYLKDAANAA